ncbi:MAG: hypothetical protein AAB250_09715 [Bdellovibrionota bacterium]
MTSTNLKNLMIGVLAVAFTLPVVAAPRKSKLKLVTAVSIEHRFRKPGEARVAVLPKKKVVGRQVVAAKRRRAEPMEITVQAHRREPIAPREQRAERQQQPKSIMAETSSFRTTMPSRSMPTYVSRMTKNNLSIEMLGKGGLYSLDYDRQLGRSVSMGLGFSYTSLRLGADEYAGVNATLITVPLYGNFYFNSDAHHRFLGTGGVTIVSAKAEATVGAQLSPEAKEIATMFVQDLDLSLNASVVVPMPVGGAGYEYKSSGGFLARASLYVVYVGEIQPWAGVALGSHF